jgi:hypothetical protein
MVVKLGFHPKITWIEGRELENEALRGISDVNERK